MIEKKQAMRTVAPALLEVSRVRAQEVESPVCNSIHSHRYMHGRGL